MQTTTENTTVAVMQIHTGTKISKGEAEPCAVRKAPKLVGINWKGTVAATANVTISSFAVSGEGRPSFFKDSIARIPIGKAAFPRPRKFAL